RHGTSPSGSDRGTTSHPVLVISPEAATTQAPRAVIYIASAARRSILPLRADQLQLLRSRRPVNRPLGFSRRLSFGGGLASEKDPLKRERPFPKLTVGCLE